MPGSSYGRALWVPWILNQVLLIIYASAGSPFTLNCNLRRHLELLILAEGEVGGLDGLEQYRKRWWPGLALRDTHGRDFEEPKYQTNVVSGCKG